MITPLTNEQVGAIVASLPNGQEGFMKGWGWLQFAHALQEGLGVRFDSPATPSEKEEAALYRILRAGPIHSIDFRTPGVPWVVAVQIDHGMPAVKAIYGVELDAAVAALAALATSEAHHG